MTTADEKHRKDERTGQIDGTAQGNPRTTGFGRLLRNESSSWIGGFSYKIGTERHLGQRHGE
ncbi:hypothetical protein AHAS_Ahas01G0160700 [Arachis hypogaea]